MTTRFNRRNGSRLVSLAVVGMMAAMPMRASAPQGVSEPALRAAFLYNFAKFADWPSDALPPTRPINLCVADTPVADALQALTGGRSIGDHPLVVSRVKTDDMLRGCGMLYASGLDVRRAAQLIASLRGASVLSVSDLDQFTKLGGIVRLFLDNGQMRFAVNVDAAARARLQLSSHLLSLATIVKDGTP